jgi:hypothetical protein
VLRRFWRPSHIARPRLGPSARGVDRLSPRRFLAADHIALPRLGYARKNAPPADALSRPAPARAIRGPVRHQLVSRIIRAAVANQRLRGRERLRRIFALALRWPHRAGRPTGLVHRAPR